MGLSLRLVHKREEGIFGEGSSLLAVASKGEELDEPEERLGEVPDDESELTGVEISG